MGEGGGGESHASSFNYLWRPFEARVPPRLSRPPPVTIIISVTRFYSRRFTSVCTLCTTCNRVRLKASLSLSLFLSPKLIKLSWFLTSDPAERASPRGTFFLPRSVPLFLSVSFKYGLASAKPRKNSPQRRDARKGIFAASSIFAAGTKIPLPSASERLPS